MVRVGMPGLGRTTAVVCLGAVGLAVAVAGQGMFSPGALNAEARSTTGAGGVRSHADLSDRCSACHVPPWAAETMADRCLACHPDVRDQRAAGRPVHGTIPNGGGDCRACHGEHSGPHAALTDLSSFDHSVTAFPLTGRHAAVSCAACHPNGSFKGTAMACASCHAEPAVHRGTFGTDCAKCHTTATWGGATFEHSFPLNHGVGKRNTSACSVCHPSAADYKQYTCYGCHRHEPSKTTAQHLRKGIADVEKCSDCHPGGKKRKGEPGRAEAAPAPDWFAPLSAAFPRAEWD